MRRAMRLPLWIPFLALLVPLKVTAAGPDFPA